MRIEVWLAITSVGLFAMFAGELISIYNFMTVPPDDFGLSFEASPKILQFISIGAAPAGILAAVAFIMSRQYGSRRVGFLIMLGGAILLAGMLACYAMTERIDEAYLSDSVVFVPILFAILSFAVIGFGAYLLRLKKRRPKKEYF